MYRTSTHQTNTQQAKGIYPIVTVDSSAEKKPKEIEQYLEVACVHNR